MLEDTTTTNIKEEGPKNYQGMIKVPLFISKKHLEECGNPSLRIQGSKHDGMLEQLDCTALGNGFKEEMNPHPHALLMSLIRPLRLGCEPWEDETNHGTFIIKNYTDFKPEVETTATPLEELEALLNIDGEVRLPPSYLNPYGFNIVMGERSP